MDTKAEEEVTSGLLPFLLNGKTRQVPELKWRQNRAWQDLLGPAFADLALGVATDTVEGQQAMLDKQRELIMAYDQTGVLGDLEEATERELDVIYNRLLEVAFPKAQSPMALTQELAQRAVQLVLESSTSGLLPTGTSPAPTPSKPASPTASSSSFTRRHRRG